ncbi:hypothetical protein KCP70_13315 [Salmonella enterica subsp. enterica]|nr:hypothetical protein KCP70_13315 [Salmonella enterica subsp. enterica]
MRRLLAGDIRPYSPVSRREKSCVCASPNIAPSVKFLLSWFSALPRAERCPIFAVCLKVSRICGSLFFQWHLHDGPSLPSRRSCFADVPAAILKRSTPRQTNVRLFRVVADFMVKWSKFAAAAPVRGVFHEVTHRCGQFRNAFSRASVFPAKALIHWACSATEPPPLFCHAVQHILRKNGSRQAMFSLSRVGCEPLICVQFYGAVAVRSRLWRYRHVALGRAALTPPFDAWRRRCVSF